MKPTIVPPVPEVTRLPIFPDDQLHLFDQGNWEEEEEVNLTAEEAYFLNPDAYAAEQVTLEQMVLADFHDFSLYLLECIQEDWEQGVYNAIALCEQRLLKLNIPAVEQQHLLNFLAKLHEIRHIGEEIEYLEDNRINMIGDIESQLHVIFTPRPGAARATKVHQTERTQLLEQFNLLASKENI